MRRVFRFVLTYKLLCLTIIVIIAVGILQSLGMRQYTNWMITGLAALAVIAFIVAMVQQVRSGSFDVDILGTAALVTAVILHQYWVAITLVLVLCVARLLQTGALLLAQLELRKLRKGLPKIAHLVQKKQPVDIAASKVAENDRLVIEPGEIVPADAVILEGNSNLDGSVLSGEISPEIKQAGERVVSGSINLDDALTVKAERAAYESQYQQTVRLLEAAQQNQAPLVRLADRYSIPFTVIAFTIAGVAWILSSQPSRFLDVLVVATPFSLVAAVPVALLAGLNRAACFGIFAKTGAAFEQLAGVKTFAFNKAGMLTAGDPVVDRVTTFAPFAEADILAYAAGVEQASNHALAAAIVTEASERELHVIKAKHVTKITSFGVEAHIGGKEVLVGRIELLNGRGVELPKPLKNKQPAQTTAYVAINNQLAGYITFSDSARQDAVTTLALLRKYGARSTILLTGDSKSAAEAVSDELNISNICAGALMGDKLRAIEDFPNKPIAFVGNKPSDASLLTLADVGIIVGAYGNPDSSEPADVLIMHDKLALVAQAMGVARRSFRIAFVSAATGLGFSFILMLIFATGKIPPLYGVVAQAVVCIVALAVALCGHLLRTDKAIE